MTLSIEITNRQDSLPIDSGLLRRAAEMVLAEAGIVDAELSIAIVNDPEMHELNRQFLDHDYPTDVLSFLLHRDGPCLEGEIIVSSDTARCLAEQVGWPPEHELLLYVVHGTLHLVGHDDATDALRGAMRGEERRILAALGIERRLSESEHSAADA